MDLVFQRNRLKKSSPKNQVCGLLCDIHYKSLVYCTGKLAQVFEKYSKKEEEKEEAAEEPRAAAVMRGLLKLNEENKIVYEGEQAGMSLGIGVEFLLQANGR